MKVLVDVPEKEVIQFFKQIKDKKFEILSEYNDFEISDSFFYELKDRSKTPLSHYESARDVLADLKKKYAL